MATDSLARLIVTLEAQTASYQRGMENAQAQLARFRQQSQQDMAAFRKSTTGSLDEVHTSFTKFSRGVGQLLAGGGIFVGVRALASTLSETATKFQDSSVGASNYARAVDLLAASYDQLKLSIVEWMSPATKAAGDIMDPATLAANRLAAATNALAEAQRKLNEANEAAVRSSVGGIKLPTWLGGSDPAKIATLEKERDARRRELEAAKATDARLSAESTKFLPGPSHADPVALVAEQLKKVGDEVDNLFARERRAGEETKRLFASVGDEIENMFEREKRASKEQLELNNKVGEEIENMFEREKRFSREAEKENEEMNKRREKAAETFGDLFANVLVQSNRDGLKQVLADFLQTLAIMSLRAQAMKLFSAAQSSGGWLGGAIDAIFGGPRAMGGPVAAGVPYMVGERGPEMFIPSGSGSISPNRGGVTINQNVTVGAGASRAEVMAAMTIAKNAAKAEINNDRRRGR